MDIAFVRSKRNRAFVLYRHRGAKPRIVSREASGAVRKSDFSFCSLATGRRKKPENASYSDFQRIPIPRPVHDVCIASEMSCK